MSRVTVVIPVYNRSGVLSRAIDSVLSQDLRAFELIVVDDRSSDGSADVARAYDDKRVRVIELDEHAGSNAARNAGIRAARSDLVAFLDSDDAFLPHKLSTVVAEFDQRPELDVLVDSFVKFCPGATRARHNPTIASTAEFRRRLFSRELWKSTSAITVRRDAAFRAGLFDENVGRRQDMDFLIRLSEVANCGATDAILWVKHWSADGISADPTFVPTTLDLVKRHPNYVEERVYRSGLSRDLTRHLLLLLQQGQFGQARTEATMIIDHFGRRKTVRLFASGTKELARRAIRRQRFSATASRAAAAGSARTPGSARS